MINKAHIPVCSLLAAIVERDKADEVFSIFHGAEVPGLHYQSLAHGTATSELLDLMGFGGTDKAITLSIVPNEAARRLLKEISGELRLPKAGKGIAFTVPLSGIGHMAASLLGGGETREDTQNRFEKEVSAVKKDLTHELIIAVINQGYSEELMEAARGAGATGGTVIHARHAGADMPARFLGISIQEEKEMVLILARHEDKVEMMRAIMQKCGMATEARGIVFSLPVNGVAGLAESPASAQEAEKPQ